MGDIERKTETVNLRLSPRMKELLRTAAEREHRTLSNMIEALVLDYCESKGIAVSQDERPAKRTRKRPVTVTRR
jgi:hypothetical protein